MDLPLLNTLDFRLAETFYLVNAKRHFVFIAFESTQTSCSTRLFSLDNAL
jgi:hypothetical protein